MDDTYSLLVGSKSQPHSILHLSYAVSMPVAETEATLSRSTVARRGTQNVTM